MKNIIFGLMIAVVLQCACESEGKLYLPELSTYVATDVTGNSAGLHGYIRYGGTPAYTERGFICATKPNMSIYDSSDDSDTDYHKMVVQGTGKGEFSVNITGLKANTTYYARAYAKSYTGISYANQISFKTTEDIP